MPGPEQLIMNSILEYLAIRGFLALRMNSGAHAVAANGAHKRRFIRYGVSGMADILMLSKGRAIFIEVKAGSKQSASQQGFESIVKSEGCLYWLCRSIDDVESQLKKEGIL